MKLSDFTKEGDSHLDRIDYPLFRAMAIALKEPGISEIEVTPEEFVMCMRYAVMNSVYFQQEGAPYILGMKVKVI